VKDRQELFPLGPIIINIFAIGILIAIYYTVVSANLVPDYQNYVYWVINVLISYNILIASARSFIAPIVTILVAAVAFMASYRMNIDILTLAQCWQVLALGVVGFFITCSIKL
jgi:hypothetical protein